jgi:hypothetical protein
LVNCPWQQTRFLCDNRHRWNHVKLHLAEVNHRPYRCIFTHPMEGHVMRISYPAAPLGKTLIGYTGIDDFENRKRSNAPVVLKVFIGPRLLHTIVHQNEWPWQRFTIKTQQYDGQTHPVRFEITAQKAYARTFCFSAETRQ